MGARANGDGRASAPPARGSERLRTQTIVAQDPSVLGEDGRILTAEVTVPVDRVEPGPRSHRFHVVDYDTTQRTLAEHPAGGAAPPRRRDAETYNDALVGSAAFRAQNAYAIATRTLASFEFALGRRLDWKFAEHQLFVVPAAFVEANAYYSREDKALLFGYVPRSDGQRPVYTSLSHDIVCHETTHAILDGLRPRFMEPSLPDQPAFHEALGDIVALLSVFSLGEVLARMLGRADRSGRIPTDSLTRRSLLEHELFGIAEQFGSEVSGVRGSALRRSASLRPGAAWRRDPAYALPHRRGEVLVAAVMRTMLGMWLRRLKPIVQAATINRERAAEEGARAAAHLLTMVIRSLDYSPAVEIEFEDVLEAIVVADELVAPDDRYAYRTVLLESFARYGIARREGGIVDLAQAPVPLSYDQLNATALRFSRQEAYRFIWLNMAELRIDSRWHLQVEALRPAVRVGPDGLVIQEVVCDYAQLVDMTVGQARRLAKRVRAERPDGPQLSVPERARLDDAVRLQMWGGGTLIFDQFGRAKLHQRKPLDDWERQSRRLAYLHGRDAFDTGGRLGFSLGSSPGMAFADMHVPDRVAGDAW